MVTLFTFSLPASTDAVTAAFTRAAVMVKLFRSMHMLGTHLLVILGQVPGVGSIIRRCSALYATWRCFQSLSTLSQSLSIHGARGSGFLLRASRSNAHSPIRRSLMLAPSTQLDAPCAPGVQAAAISAAARSFRTQCKRESRIAVWRAGRSRQQTTSTKRFRYFRPE